MPSSSLFLRSSATLVAALSLLSAPLSVTASPFKRTTQAYQLDTAYNGSAFFSGMDFYTEADPSNGFVTYRGQSQSETAGLVSQNPDGSWFIGVDSTNTYAWNGVNYAGVNGLGRQSVRFQSEKTWQYGLFIADIAHMPGGLCGTWPAFWTIGDGTWPYTGEIDILESSNALQQTLTSLHTGNTCSIDPTSNQETGTLQHTDCDYNSGGSGANPVGCGVTGSTATYGTQFNTNGGGVYAMEWTSGHIATWFFPRGSIPEDLTTDSPDPTQWGLPYAYMAGGCDFSATNFQDHRVVVDNTFCGDLGDATWGTSGCATSSGDATCAQFVGENPGAFVDAYWTFNAIKVYQLHNVNLPTTSSSTSSTTSSSTTSSIYVHPTQISTQPGVSFPVPTGSTSFPYTTPSPTSHYVVPTSTVSSWTTTSTSTVSSWITTSTSTVSSWTTTSTSTGSTTSATGWSDNDRTGAGAVFGFPKGCPIGAMPTQWYSAIHSTASSTYSGAWSTSYSSADPTWGDWTSTTTTTTSTSADPTWGDWTSSTTTTDPADSTWADWTSTTTTATSSSDPTWADWTSGSSADPTWSAWTSTTTATTTTGSASWTWAATSSTTTAATATWSGQSSWVADPTSPYSTVWTGGAASFGVGKVAGAVVAVVGVAVAMV